jgi:chromosome partitioning protein
MIQTYTVQRLLNIYAMNIARGTIIKAEESGLIPQSQRQHMGSIARRGWRISDLPRIGERYGFLAHLDKSLTMVFFTTKGGVLKTTLAYHMARTAALHNVKTCVVGLDLQNDVTRILENENEPSDDQNIDELLDQSDCNIGIAGLYRSNKNLKNVIMETDIPTLSYIPEGPELIRLEKQLHSENKRESWLKKHVIEPLKKEFELIVVDCPPNWNLLVSNALVASDILVSPVECRINQFRNLAVFQDLIEAFHKDMDLHFKHIYVPTRFCPMKKLNSDIRRWYLKNLPGVINNAIRESNFTEEAISLRKSVMEHAPKGIIADEMREVIKELWLCAREKVANDASSKRKNLITTNQNFELNL